MNLAYLICIIPAAYFLQRAMTYLISISGKKWKQLLLLAACWVLLGMVIFIGDRTNILLTIPAFLVVVWWTCEGSFWKKTEIGLLFSSTVLAFNTFRDNYIMDVSFRHENHNASLKISGIGCYVLALLLYGGVRKFAPDRDYELSESMWKLLSLLTATPLSVILSIVVLYRYNVREGGGTRSSHLEYAALCLIVLMSFIGLLWAVTVLAKQQKLERRSMLMEANQSYYELMEQQHFEIRRIRHDMANHLSVLAALPEEQRTDYIRELTENITDIRPMRYCADATVNAVLAVKESRMARYGIRWEVITDISEELPFERTDICALYANALDNAVEACMKLEEEKRKIVLESRAQKGLFCMTVRNPVPGLGSAAISVSGDIPRTSKPDKENHGFGLKSIREIVGRYHGEMELKVKEEIIELFLYMPMSDFS